MNETKEMTGFEHDGFKCTIIQRPELCFLWQVHGYREADDKEFLPNLLFEQNLTVEEIRDACIAIMDGDFSGKVERYRNFNVMVGV